MEIRVIYSSLFLSSLFAFGFIFGGCSFDAERDNPLDPKSDNYQPSARLEGNVTMLNDSIPIAGAAVTLYPDSITLYTGQNGHYSIDRLEAGDYTVALEHPNFFSMSCSVKIFPGQTNTQNFNMNALPSFDSVSITSQRYIFNSFLEYFYKLKVFANISDPDGGLRDSAVVVWSGGYSANLSRQPGTSFYIVLLDTNNFIGSEVENMLGIQFIVQATDISGGTAQSNPFQLVRIIKSIIRPHRPSGTSSGNPTFEWSRALSPPIEFDDYIYRLFVYNETQPEMVRYEAVIDSVTDTIAITYVMNDDTLDAGSYSWRVQVEDSFGNFSRCEKAYFDVQ